MLELANTSKDQRVDLPRTEKQDACVGRRNLRQALLAGARFEARAKDPRSRYGHCFAISSLVATCIKTIYWTRMEFRKHTTCQTQRLGSWPNVMSCVML